MKYKDLNHRQKKRFFITFLMVVGFATTYLIYAVYSLYTDKITEDAYWESYMEAPSEYTSAVAQRGKGATQVEVGTYVENLKEINIKSSNFRAVYEV